jgi:simple sugar transport system ATP-binding protein
MLLELSHITKTFGNLVANDDISLDVRQGEVHALLGENGAGKTTLMNILYGLYHPDSGEIRLRGEVVHIHSPRDAIRLRIGMVHQHFMLIPNLTVVENVILGQPAPREPLLDLRQAADALRQLADRYGLQVEPGARVSDLPVGVQQRVEILKSLARGADLLILDEPTAVLSPLEVQDFFRVLKTLVGQGLSVILISHKLDEVLEVSDRITVLRRGQKVATMPTSEANKQLLADLMVGKEVITQVERPAHQPGSVVLKAQGLRVLGGSGRPAIKDIDLTIHGGEIVGIAGVDGNGQQELAEALVGLRSTSSGQIWINGHDLTHHPPAAFLRQGVSYIPADRQKVGLILDFSVQDNLVIKAIDRSPYARRGMLQLGAIAAFAHQVIQRYDIRASSETRLVRQLSGGNQQKVALAREIEEQPSLLIAMHPTRGLDIGAMQYVQQKILEQRARGVAVLLISTELEEILALSDRILVLFRGEIMGCVSSAEARLSHIAAMMLGERASSPVRAAQEGEV